MQRDDRCDGCVKKARELGGQYVQKYWGCAQSTFAAVIDALRSAGVELVSPEIEDEMFKGLVGLSGGVGNMGVGNCGALTGASFAVSLASGVGRNEQLRDKDHRWIAYDNVAETIGKKFLDTFGGTSCREVTWKRWGKQYNSWIPEIKQEFAREEMERGCLSADKCTQPMVAGWAVEFILDIIENPKTLEQVKQGHKL
jgi:hypothetical protein